MTRFSSSYWRDIGWQASGNTLAQFVGVAGVPVLTRLYSPADFAAQSLFIQIVTFGTAIVTWRFEYFVQLPRKGEEARAINGLVFFAGLAAISILTPILWLFQQQLADQLGNPSLAPWMVLAPLTAVLVSWSVATQNNAQRQRNFRDSGLAELAGKISYVLTGIAAALTQLGSLGLIITTALGAAAKTGFIATRKPTTAIRAFNFDAPCVKSVAKQYGKLASATVVSHLLSTAAVAIPQIALARLYGSEVLGQFALVLATVYLPSGLLGAAIGQVYYQRAGAIWADQQPFFDLWKETLRKLLFVGTPVYGAIALLAPIAYPLIFGSNWHLAGTIASIMSIAAYGSFITSPLDKSCLVVGAWRYSIAWSAFRVLSTLMVVIIAEILQFTPTSFITVLAFQMCCVYGLDLWASWSFSQGRLGIFRSQQTKSS